MFGVFVVIRLVFSLKELSLLSLKQTQERMRKQKRGF